MRKAIANMLFLWLFSPVSFAWWTGMGADPWQTPRLEAETVEPFFDGLIGAQIAAYEIPGAVVSIVYQGKTLLAKGYGLADVATGTPVQAERTLFRAGSVAKVVTWMALLQLSEKGALALDQDVNTYLGELALPETFPEPVRAADLMTHSAGFEDRFGGLFATDAESVLSLSDYLRRHRPARVRSPGRITAYSNYGAALAGHLLERVTGTPFASYVAEQIFQPLGMPRSTFAQPVPESLRSDLATGYGKQLEPLGFEWLQGEPSGALSTTATDMARLMKAILGGGRLGDVQILEETSVEAMLTRKFANHQRLAGLTFGFQEYFLNGQRLLWHPGDTLGFSSALILIPKQGLGLFVSYNRLADSQPRADLLKTFLDRFYPPPPSHPPTPSSGAAGRGRRLAGSYIPTRSNFTGPEKVFKLFRPVTVELLADGRLRTHGLWVVKNGLWVEVEPGLYRHDGGREVALFQVHGNQVVLLEGNYPQGAYIRLPWYGTHSLHGLLWFTAAVGFLASLGTGAVRIVRARLARSSTQDSPQWSGRLVELMSLVQLLVLFGLLVALANLRALASRVDMVFGALGLLAVLGAVLAMLALAAQLWGWRPGAELSRSRWFYRGVALVGVAFSLSLAFWGVLPLP